MVIFEKYIKGRCDKCLIRTFPFYFISLPFFLIEIKVLFIFAIYFSIFDSFTRDILLYFIGILASHGSMTLERLHSMLRLISNGSESNEAKFDMNLVQLRRYLQTSIDTNQLEFFDDSYRIRK